MIDHTGFDEVPIDPRNGSSNNFKLLTGINICLLVKAG